MAATTMQNPPAGAVHRMPAGDLSEAAHRQGRRKGRREGRFIGREEGRAEGMRDGLALGWDEGLSEGEQRGFASGCLDMAVELLNRMWPDTLGADRKQSLTDSWHDYGLPADWMDTVLSLPAQPNLWRSLMAAPGIPPDAGGHTA